MKELFKNKSFALMFQGALVSAIGTSLYGFAAGLYVQDLFGEDGGAIYLSLFLAVSVLVRVVVSPFAGALVDKLNRIRIIYITDYIRGGLFFLTLYVLTLGLSPEAVMVFLLVVTALSSLNQAFFGPATSAALPEIVGEDMLQAANGADSIIGSTQTILGVVAGMFLYELLGFEIAVLINAISFILSGFSEMFIKTKFKQESVEPKEEQHFIQDIKFGFQYMKRTNGLLRMMIFSLFLNFAFGPFLSIGFPYLFRTELGTSAYPLGITQILFSIAMLVSGVIVGGWALKSLRKTVKFGILAMTTIFALTSIAVVGITYGYLSFNFFYIIFVVLNILMAVAMIITNVPMNTAFMKVIEPSVRGRVFSTLQAMSSGLIPVAMILGGIIVDQYNVAALGIFSSIILLFPTLGLLFSTKIEKFFDIIDEKEEQRKLELQPAI